MQIFLLLNYNSSNDTINLINQIKHLNQPIVVVDNASPGYDYNKLAEFINHDKNITLLRSDTNVGFAQGNNIGYEYIKKNYFVVDAIHCLNSDIYIRNVDNLLKDVEKNIKNNYLLAPGVYTNGYKSNPMLIRNDKTLKEDIARSIKMYKKKIIKHKIARMFGKFYKKYMLHNQSFVQTSDYQAVHTKLKENEYYVYNGCYLIFTNKYIKEYDYLFNPNTFLYYEEDLLCYRLNKYHQPTMLVDSIEVDHLENQDSRSDVVKRYQRLLASAQVLYKEVEND